MEHLPEQEQPARGAEPGPQQQTSEEALEKLLIETRAQNEAIERALSGIKQKEGKEEAGEYVSYEQAWRELRERTVRGEIQTTKEMLCYPSALWFRNFGALLKELFEKPETDSDKRGRLLNLYLQEDALLWGRYPGSQYAMEAVIADALKSGGKLRAYIRQYAGKNTRQLIGLFAQTGNEELLKFASDEMRQHLETDPDDLLAIFSQTNNEKLWEISPDMQQNITQYFDIADILNRFYETHNERLLKLIPKQELERYAKWNSEYIFRLFLNTGNEYLLELVDAEQANLFRQEAQARRQEKQTKDVLAMIRCGFYDNETLVSLAPSEADYAPLKRDFDILRALGAEAQKHQSTDTVGVEIEVLNSEDEEAELQLPVVRGHGHDLEAISKFLADFSHLTYQQFDRVRKETPEKFPGYPHSNLHLNFGMTREEEQNAWANIKTLEDLSYCYALAYAPFSRIDYLENHISGRFKRNSIDYDVQKTSPETMSRYQVRFFAIGGTGTESKSAIQGIEKIIALFPRLLRDPDAVARAKETLDKDVILQNAALELKWIIQETKKVENGLERAEVTERVLAEETELLNRRIAAEEAIFADVARQYQDLLKILKTDAEREQGQKLFERREELQREIPLHKAELLEKNEALRRQQAVVARCRAAFSHYRRSFIHIQKLLQCQLELIV